MEDTDLMVGKGGEVYNKWQQLYLLISEWLEEYDDEELEEYDAGSVNALENVQDAILQLNEGKFPYHVN